MWEFCEKLRNDGLIWKEFKTKRFKNWQKTKKQDSYKFYTVSYKKRMRVIMRTDLLDQATVY